MRRVTILGVVMCLVAGTSYAGPIREAAARATMAQAKADDWQKQYSGAQAEKNAGKKKMLIGAAAATVGVIIAAAGTNSCVNDLLSGNDCGSTSNSAMTLGWIADLGGSGMFVWGLVQFIDGNGEMNRLNANRPSPPAASIDLSQHTSLVIEAGARSAVGYRVSW